MEEEEEEAWRTVRLLLQRFSEQTLDGSSDVVGVLYGDKRSGSCAGRLGGKRNPGSLIGLGCCRELCAGSV